MRTMLILLLLASVVIGDEVSGKLNRDLLSRDLLDEVLPLSEEERAAERALKAAAKAASDAGQRGPDPRYGTYNDKIPLPGYSNEKLTKVQQDRRDKQNDKYGEMYEAPGDRPHLWLLTHYDLADELELSEQQLRSLSALTLPSPFSAQNAILRGESFPVSDKVFEDFVRRFPGQLRRELAASNDEVKEILDESQFVRLEQIYFQLHVFIYPKLAVALRTHGESLPKNEAVKISRELKQLKRSRGSDKRLIELVIWREKLMKLYGKDKINKAMGKPFLGRELVSEVSELVKASAKTKTADSRRRR